MDRTPFMRAGLDDSGFTLLEAVVVLVILGALAALLGPNMVRAQHRLGAREGVTMVAGVLEEARDQAIARGVPHLVYIQQEEHCDADRAPFATIVVDNDASYSVTAGDLQQEVALSPSIDCQVTPYGDGETTPFAGMTLPVEDLSPSQSGTIPAEVVVGAVASAATSGADPGTLVRSAIETAKAAVGAAVGVTPTGGEIINGATFPIDDATGGPALAFNERGVPVAPATPTDWGSGVGGYYLTDNATTVYAAVVGPLGQVGVKTYDPAEDDWK